MTIERAKEITMKTANELVDRITKQRLMQSWRDEIQRRLFEMVAQLQDGLRLGDQKDKVVESINDLAFLISYDPRRPDECSDEHSSLRCELESIVACLFDEVGDLKDFNGVDDDDDFHDSYTEVSNED